MCYGYGRVYTRIDGKLPVPLECNYCGGTGRVDKDTFMEQVKQPLFETNNLKIIELYENYDDLYEAD